MIIAVVGGSKATPDALTQAEAVGRELAQRGHTVICGGLGGVMEAACRGAREAGGHTIGVLPGPDPQAANEHVEFPIVTNMGVARNTVIILSSAAVIAVDGSYGTLSEIAIALNSGRPVVGLDTWRISHPDDDATSSDEEHIVRAEDAAQAVKMAISAAGGGN